MTGETLRRLLSSGNVPEVTGPARQNTPEQDAIMNLGKTTKDNIMINSYAGTGKTTTLELLESVVKQKPILYLVFNKKNAKEAERRMASTTTVRTFNGMGHRIWSKFAVRKTIKLESKYGLGGKCKEILNDIISSVPRSDQGPLWDSWYSVLEGVGKAKNLGYIPEGTYPTATRLCTQADLHNAMEEAPDDLVSDLIDAVLTRSTRAAYDGWIDFDDQVYMPALFGGQFPQFPLLLVDEYQDLSPVNHRMLEKAVRTGPTASRIIGVGDPWQNIYGFRGAKSGGMHSAEQHFAMVRTELSVSFRCPEAVVKHARWRVPGFQWIKPGGRVEALKVLDLDNVAEHSTFVCRNNAPLFSLALRLLAGGHSVSVAGSDIGAKLVSLMKKIASDDADQATFKSAIDDWLAEKLERENKAAPDLAACMHVFCAAASTKSGAIAYAEHLFKSDGTILLTTIHKAKGLEWPHVYHLDPWLCSDSEQDKNLRYVATTRSSDTLFEIDSRNIHE